MTRFIVDAAAAVHLAREGIGIAAGHELLAPTLVRSQTLSMLHEAVHAGELDAASGRDLVGRVGQLKMRLLGDAVLRRRAWDLAEQLGLASTYGTEYVALTQLQGDALVALDPAVAGPAEGLVALATIADLR